MRFDAIERLRRAIGVTGKIIIEIIWGRDRERERERDHSSSLIVDRWAQLTNLTDISSSTGSNVHIRKYCAANEE